MRNISLASLDKLSQTEGLEPINYMDVHWRGVNPRSYSDQMVPGLLEGKILELTNLENVINIAGNSSSQAITVKLDDTDGSIKAIMDVIDIHKTPVYVFQWFKGLPISDAFIIFEGEISSPIEWNEAERTVTFEVLSKITDKEVGFSIEEGDFEYVPPQLIGQAWPLVFGTALRVKGLRSNDPPSGVLAEAVGVGDHQVNADSFRRIAQNNQAAFDKARDAAITASIYARDAYATASKFAFIQEIANNKGTGENFTSIIDQMNQIANDMNQRSIDYQVQMDEIRRAGVKVDDITAVDTSLEKGSVPVVNGNLFPQGQSVNLNINSTQGTAVHEGVFNGSTFVITNRSNPIADDLGILETAPTEVTENNTAVKYEADVSKRSIWIAGGGTTVNISSNSIYPVTYVVSLMFTQVPVVWSYRTFNGIKHLAVVPPDRYVIQYLNFGPVQVTLLKMLRPLSSYVNEGWEDDIYCDVVSPIGPNVVDIMKFLIQSYTSFTWDTISFDYVRAKVHAFPAHFSLNTRPNVIQLLQQIAFQSRCAIWFSNGKFYLKYLPDEGTPVDTITDDDIEFGSLKMTCTPTEDIVTKFTAKWKPDGSTSDYRAIFRHNVAKYGIQEEEYDFFIYNFEGYVEKSAIFWMIRKSNTWKTVQFTTFLTKLKLEPYDMVTLNLSQPFFSNGPVTAMVQSVRYDSENNRLEISLWLPVRFGEMTQYPFALPANISETLIFPTPTDLPGGGGPGANAKGTLYNQGPIVGVSGTKNFSRPNKDVGSNKRNVNVRNPGYFPAISDQGEQPHPSTTTYVNPNVNTSLDPSGRTVRKHRQWQLKELAAPVFSEVLPGTWPGFVDSQQSGTLYNCRIFYNGLDGESRAVTARQVDQGTDDKISPNTPVLITRVVWTESSSDVNGESSQQRAEYVINAPIWQPELQQ